MILSILNTWVVTIPACVLLGAGGMWCGVEMRAFCGAWLHAPYCGLKIINSISEMARKCFTFAEHKGD